MRLATGPIGILDSGVGGLSVLRQVRARLPAEDLLYFADQHNVPYGARPLDEVRGFVEAIARFLLAREAKLIVLACNTASAAALRHLRAVLPQVPFVGMEPAVKPAAEGSHTGTVGVLATPATFQGELFASVTERFARGVIVLRQVCPGLVERIEAGDLDSPATEARLRECVAPMLARGIDALVLGCTHYPFVIPALERICGPTVRVIDPSPAIARQVERVLTHERIAAPPGRVGRLTYFSSGPPDGLRRLLPLLGVEAGEVRAAEWVAGEVRAA